MEDRQLRPPGPPPLGKNPLSLLRCYRALRRDPIGIAGKTFFDREVEREVAEIVETPAEVRPRITLRPKRAVRLRIQARD